MTRQLPREVMIREMNMKKLIIKTVFLVFALTSLVPAAGIAAGGAGTIEAVYGTPVIDGNAEEIWDAAPEDRIELFTMETHGAHGTFRCMWDEEKLYVLAKVIDPVLSTAADAAHMQDSVEIFLDENSGRTDYYEYDDAQYRVNCENERSLGTGALESGFESAVTKTEDGYIVEAAIPFKSIKGSVGKKLGFEIQINDDGDGSGERSSIAKFNDPTDLSYTNTSLFGELTLAGPEPAFSDLAESDEAEIVSYLAAKGTVNGYDGENFVPGGTVTREEFVKLLAGIFGIAPAEGGTAFSDVVPGAWYEGYINSAVSAGVVRGISETEFGVGVPVSTEEAAEMTRRVMEYFGAAPDTGIDALSYMVSMGFADGGASAEEPMRRDKSAAMLYRAYVHTDAYLTEKQREEDKLDSYGKELIDAAGAKEIGCGNPVYTQRFGADPFAMEYNGRIYLYMTGDKLMYDENKDIKDNDYSNVNTISVISSADLINWTDHGEIVVGGRTDPDGAAKWAGNSWAPAAAHKTIDGKEKFFLYFADNGSGIGVLESDSPTGSFTDPIGGALIKPGVTPGSDGVVWYFDPALFIDDDGQAYLYFGGGLPTKEDGTVEADHPNTVRVIKLGDDMISTVGEAVTIDAPAVFEDSGIHKYNGKYYYSYCTNFEGSHEDGKYPFGAIVYMTSDDPMGPFEYEGQVLANMADFFGVGGNNHHAIFEFKDKWYITYHAQTVGKYLGIEKGYRSTHINELSYDDEGNIIPVEADYKGAEPVGTLDPYSETSAATMAWLSGITTAPAGEPGKMYLKEIDDGDWTAAANVDFGTGAKRFIVNAAPIEGGCIELRLDAPDGTLVGSVDISGAEGTYKDYSCEVTGAEGTHNLFLLFRGEEGNSEAAKLFEAASWRFEK